jgi:hypothetical protein
MMNGRQDTRGGQEDAPEKEVRFEAEQDEPNRETKI